jgi:hypothetical protein
MTPAVCERQASGHHSERLCVLNWPISETYPGHRHLANHDPERTRRMVAMRKENRL